MPKRSGMDIERLVKDAVVIRRATDIVEISVHRSCDARTRGADGFRAVDVYQETSHEERQEALAEFLDLDIESFKAKLPKLRRAEVPKGPADDLIEDPMAQFVLGHESSKDPKMRPIVVPTVVGDMLVRAFDEALVRTYDPMLPDSAMAYRKVPDPVATILKGAAGFVRAELRAAKKEGRAPKPIYWTCLDIENFFPSMSHEWMGESLAKLGASDWTTSRVIALANSPLEGESKVPGIGCPAGLRISGTLANIYLRDLDIELARRFPKVWNRRYSDDIPLMSLHRPELIAAVKFVRSWLEALGHELKGVGKRTRSDYLVHRITPKRPMDVLGARITSKGNIVMQPKKVAAFKAKLRRRIDLLKALGPVIGGVSMYSDYGRAKDRGRYAYDLGDIQDMLTQIEQYWGLLNGPLAIDFLAGLRREYGADLDSLESGLSGTWTAWLPSGSRRPHRGASRAPEARLSSALQLQETLSAVVQDLAPTSSFQDGQGLEGIPGSARQRMPMGTHEVLGGNPDDTRSWPTQSKGHPHREGEVRHQDLRTEDQHGHDDHVPTGEVPPRLKMAPEDLKDLPENEEIDPMDRDLQIGKDLEVGFASASRVKDGSLSLVATTNVVEIRVLEVERLGSRRKPHRRTLIGVERGSGQSQRWYQHGPQSALLMACTAELERAQGRGHRTLVIRTESWLPKHLLRQTARFHSVVLFDLVERLHHAVEAGETDLVLVGFRKAQVENNLRNAEQVERAATSQVV